LLHHYYGLFGTFIIYINMKDLFKAIEKIKQGHTGSAINFIERYINTRDDFESILHQIVHDSHCSKNRIIQPANSNKCAEFVNNWIENNLK